MSIIQEFRHNIYGKSTKTALPLVECKSKATVQATVDTDLTGLTGLVGHVYEVASPTGLNDPWVIISGDHATGAILSYTGYGSEIAYTFDPTYLTPVHGQNYGIEFTAYDADNITVERTVPM